MSTQAEKAGSKLVQVKGKKRQLNTEMEKTRGTGGTSRDLMSANHLEGRKKGSVRTRD